MSLDARTVRIAIKKNVPKKLRHLIGKDTLYRQLGESYSEAMKVLPKVHSEIEALFEAE